jgi:biotin operon repressor
MELTARMVRGYKGAAASILLLFLAGGGQPLTQSEMRRGTGYGDEAINDAVWMLREDGRLVQTARYTWSLLTDGMRQLPVSSDGPVLPDPAPDHPELAVNELRNESMNDIEIDDSLIHSGSSGNSGPASVDALKKLGFYGRGITDLMAIEGLTMREVLYHVKTAPSLGAALARIRKRQKAPPDGHERDGPGDRRKYIEGEFADFIEH